jgi:hypothetical protein
MIVQMLAVEGPVARTFTSLLASPMRGARSCVIR